MAAAGKAATPQRHEHSPAELVVPATKLLDADAAAAVAVFAAAIVPAGGAAAVEVPAVDTAAAPDALAVPFWAIAAASNCAWVLLAVGLMEKVMPLPQCPVCLQ
jgi:hypothetical protein